MAADKALTMVKLLRMSRKVISAVSWIPRVSSGLRQSGLLGAASAVVCAEFPGCGDETGRNARSVCTELLADFPGPVLFGFPSGHTRGPALTLPFGVTVTVAADASPGLIVEEAAVS